MQEELVSFQVAKLAKEKGFDIVCSYLYENEEDIIYATHKNSGLNKHFDWYSAPTQTLLQRWLREVHNIRVLIDFETIDDSTTAYTYKIVRDIPEGKGRKKDTWDFYEITYSFNQGGGWYETYEEALEIGLQKSLKLIKNE